MKAIGNLIGFLMIMILVIIVVIPLLLDITLNEGQPVSLSPSQNFVTANLITVKYMQGGYLYIYTQAQVSSVKVLNVYAYENGVWKAVNFNLISRSYNVLEYQIQGSPFQIVVELEFGNQLNFVYVSEGSMGVVG